MNPRERFLNTMHFEPVDRIPLWEWGPWATTVARWRSEGMPGTGGVPQFTDCDPRLDCGVSFAMIPPFERIVLEEDENTITYISEKGQRLRELRQRELSMPEHLEYPVKNRKDWLEIRKRFDPETPQRYPADWDARLEVWQKKDAPLQISGGRYVSFFGGVRELMGPVATMLAMYDNPNLVHEMMEYFAYFFIGVMKKALSEAPVDWVIMWEDMAYHTASLISPKMFREFMLPNYKKVTDFIRSHGVDIIFVDSDGNVEELIPLWLEGGVNGIYPMEANAGMDVVDLRKKYGKNLLMTGGIDKRVLAWGKEYIDAELQRKVAGLIDKGGYIPTIDHSIPPDVPYENFVYYWEQKKGMILR